MIPSRSARLFPTIMTVALACCCWRGCLRTHAEDYLTPDEVEQLREAQEPHLRLKVLEDLLENRLVKARALKDPASVRAKPPEPKLDKKKHGKPDKPDVIIPA